MQVPKLLMSSVASMMQHNKKQYAITLQGGQMLDLQVSDMFHVQLQQHGRLLANMHFQPLSSLNNLEMPPDYRVASLLTDQGEVPEISEALLTCLYTVYGYYTRGSIRPWRRVVK